MEFIVAVDYYITADTQAEAYAAVDKLVSKSKISCSIIGIEEG